MNNIDNVIVHLESILQKPQIHGSNILGKLKNYNALTAYQKTDINSVVPLYLDWLQSNLGLTGYDKLSIQKRVDLLVTYREKVKHVDFKFQSKFHSTILEEFLYYLFKDLLSGINQTAPSANIIEIGGIKAYSNLYFAPENLTNFIKTPHMRVNYKDQDFAIYRNITLEAGLETIPINVPIVSIECKTYLDKTMLDGSIATADKIKSGNPYCLYIIVTDYYDVGAGVDPIYSRVDQIFVLTRGSRRDKKPLNYLGAVDLFDLVRKHLERDWSTIGQKLIEEGKII